LLEKKRVVMPETNHSGTSAANGQTKFILELLEKSLDRQIAASEKTCDKVEQLGDRLEGSISNLSKDMGKEMRDGMRTQTKLIFWLLCLSIIFLGSVAGVQFFGHWGSDGVTISTDSNAP